MPAGCIVNGTAVQNSVVSAHCAMISATPEVDAGYSGGSGFSVSITRHISAVSQ